MSDDVHETPLPPVASIRCADCGAQLELIRREQKVRMLSGVSKGWLGQSTIVARCPECSPPQSQPSDERGDEQGQGSERVGVVDSRDDLDDDAAGRRE